MSKHIEWGEPTINDDLDAKGLKHLSLSEMALLPAKLQAAQHVITEHRLRNSGGVGMPAEFTAVEKQAFEIALEFIAINLTSYANVKESK